MITFAPFSTVAGQPTAQAMPSRVNPDGNPGQSAQAEATPSARATVRAQAATSADSAPTVRPQIEEGPGAETRRVNLSTEEFIARRRFRAEKRRAEAEPLADATSRLRATRAFQDLSDLTATGDTGSTQPSSLVSESEQGAG